MQKAFNKYDNPKIFHTVNILIIILICVLVEVFICNANSFHVRNKEKYEQKKYTLGQLEIIGADVNTDLGTITYRSEYSGYLVLFIIVIYCFAVAFFRAISGPFGYTLTYHPDFYYTLERACSFWK